MQKFASCLLAMMLLIALPMAVLAEEQVYKGEVTALVGNESTVWGNYQINQQWDLTGIYDEEALKTGVHYRLSDKLGFKAGVRYDIEPEAEQAETLFYGGFDYKIPFGNNLNLVGYYDYNYEAENCGQYESAVRIEMYPGQYLLAGVRGNVGIGAPTFGYNEGKEDQAMLFIKGDFNWQIKKFDIRVSPVLYIQGHYFHDYDVKYTLNERTKLVLNISSIYDSEIKYRAGLEYKF